MKKSLVVCLLAFAVAGPAVARNVELKLPWADVLESPEAKSKLDKAITLRFGDHTLPAGAERKGDDTVNRIAKGRSRHDDVNACKAAAVEALAALQERAKQLGANAVVDIVSHYKNNKFASATEYECHAGGTGGHLTFKATFAIVPK
jgi:uncharacterized protein YbjQ (UPF0145 family)